MASIFDPVFVIPTIIRRHFGLCQLAMPDPKSQRRLFIALIKLAIRAAAEHIPPSGAA